MLMSFLFLKTKSFFDLLMLILFLDQNFFIFVYIFVYAFESYWVFLNPIIFRYCYDIKWKTVFVILNLKLKEVDKFLCAYPMLIVILVKCHFLLEVTILGLFSYLPAGPFLNQYFIVVDALRVYGSLWHENFISVEKYLKNYVHNFDFYTFSLNL